MAKLQPQLTDELLPAGWKKGPTGEFAPPDQAAKPLDVPNAHKLRLRVASPMARSLGSMPQPRLPAHADEEPVPLEDEPEPEEPRAEAPALPRAQAQEPALGRGRRVRRCLDRQALRRGSCLGRCAAGCCILGGQSASGRAGRNGC